MGDRDRLFPSASGNVGSGTRQSHQPDGQRDELAEARSNLKLAIIVLALAAALPCAPVIVGMTAEFGLPVAASIWLNLFATGAFVVKWASIAYGISRYSTV
jgi:hypothetical protein